MFRQRDPWRLNGINNRGVSPRANSFRYLRLEALEDRRLLDAGELSSEFPFDQLQDSSVLPETPVVPGEILLKLAPGALNLNPKADPAAKAGPEYGTETLGGLLTMYQASRPKAAFPSLVTEVAHTKAGTKSGEELTEEEAAREELSRWYSVQVDPRTDIETLVAAFAAVPEVEFAEGNIEWGLTDEIPTIIEGLPDATTDPAYDEQWFHTNAKIPNAWYHLNTNGVYPGGKRDVVVAVVDTGVDYTHEELAGNMWVNPDEIPGNGIDDDLNGFVDDIHGCSVVSDGRSHAGDPVDFHGHGTHVAGVVAAQGFNGTGGVGVAFNTQIMAVRAAQYSGTLTTQDISEGILYAVDNGAEVINMSFGGYQWSQIVVDSLKVALNQCVLVAAAGNDSLLKVEAPHYPAALPWVLGVEATTSTDRLAWFSNMGYEIKAPGVSIYSTLPNNGYAAWSGTSMATPLISGIAALMRSYFWQRDVYSSRFIMGSITASGEKTDPITKQTYNGVVDAYRALTEPPKPGVDLYENWLFDDKSIDSTNDDDGRADSGETLHIAVELINRSGLAENVTATLVAQAEGAVMQDPYVTITTDTVAFGNIGPFAIADNGLVWNEEGIITHVEVPLVFTVSPDCPNDHVIPFVLTTTFQDGWDEEHTSYKRVSRFNYVVQRGRNVPTVISEDTELTSDEYWIVGGPVLIEAGATLTIKEGTQIQWGAISDDPYNPGPQTGYIIVRGNLIVEGVEENPVSLFPSYLVSGQTVDIRVDTGTASMYYTEVLNPRITSFDVLDHVYFRWDRYASSITATRISNCVFDKLRGGGTLSASEISTSLYSAGYLGPGSSRLYNNVFLSDYENNKRLTLTAPTTFLPSNLNSFTRSVYREDDSEFSGMTYAILSVEYTDIAMVELAVNYLGGHAVSVSDETENEYIRSFIVNNWPPGVYHTFYIGLSDAGNDGTYMWLDGTPVQYTNWANGAPAELGPGLHVVRFGADQGGNGGVGTPIWTAQMPEAKSHNNSQDYIVRIPGEWTLEDLNSPEVRAGMEAYIRENYLGNWQPVRENAFLNKYWDPNLDHWMRVYGASGSTGFASLHDNYWGTDSTTLIDHAIWDYYDTFTNNKVDYGTPPEHGFESTYPFVETVLINGVPAESVPEVGAGPTTFTINFNRDMDPTVQPLVTFGPSSPYTDFIVHPIGGNDAGYNDNVVEFTVTLSTACSQTVSVNYATNDDTAIGGVDFASTSGTLTFEPGQTQATIEVPILGDIHEELDKSFIVQLSDPTFATLADDTATGTLEDDDPTLSVDEVTIREGDGETVEAVFTVTLSAAKEESVTVVYETEDGSAEAGIDYETTEGTLTFEPGELTRTIVVPIIGNTIHDGDRAFTVRLLHPRLANIGVKEGAATIVDDDPLIAVEDLTVVEGDADTTSVSATVRLSAPAARTITVDYTTMDDTAIPGEDYQTAGGTITFLEGEQEQNITLDILGDIDAEVNETFLIDLSGAVGGVIDDAQGTVTILGDDGPVLSVDDVALTEGHSGTTDAVFTVTLSANPTASVTVDYATGDVTATAGDDYQAVSGTLTFAPGGPLTQTVAVSVNGDTLNESDETFSVILSNPGAAMSDWIGEATILNDDPLLSVNDVEIIERDSETADAVFTVSLSADSGETVTVDYATHNGKAIAGQDYQVTAGTLTFHAGGPLTQTVSVPILGDTADEMDEDFVVVLSAATNAEIADAEGTGTILNDDLPVVTVDDAFVWEGDDGTAYLDFVLHLSADPLSAVTVDYDTSDATAILYEDYEPAHGTITWQPGEPLDRTVSVPVLGDTADEGDETLVLDLSNVTQAIIGDTQAAGTIQDDEPTISIDDVKLVEGDSGSVDAVFTVVLDSPPQRTVTVDYATADGTATAGEDYSSVTGTLTFEPGQPTTQTITVSVSGDTDNETNETFSVNLSGATGARIIAPHGLGTIVGDDGPLVSIADAGFTEWDSGTTNQAFTVTISADPPERVVVDYRTVAGTAAAGLDYNSVSATLVFDPGQPLTQTILVPILGDTTSEADETFSIELTNATVVGISDDEATGTIHDDDALISIDDVTITEGVTGAVDMIFTVSISMDPPDTVTVDYATAGVTATEGTDYLGASGTLAFAPGGPGTQTITVTALGDIVNEIHETFSVELTNLVNANFTNDVGTGTITDDDGPKLAIDDVTVTEGDSGTVDAVFTVSLTETATETITVNWATSGDSALSGIDFEAASGTLTFEQGQPTSRQVTVTVNADAIDELDETFLVELSEAAGAPILDDAGEATIADDDSATLSINDVTAAEGYNGWINARTWQGTFWVTPMTGESYHLMRISGAVAADDPWLVSGYDVGRFRFEVETMGVAAMTLQASGMEGAVGLNWAQDDFELLAGYNVYRSDTIDGTYERLNQTIIPVGRESYIDNDVTPAVPMYYQFTVVQTDNSESDPSNVASAAAVDTVAPTISHAPPTSSIAGYAIHIDAEVADNVDVNDVLVYYRTLGSTDDYGTLALSNISADQWSVNIPGSQVVAPGLEYYLTASDGINLVYDGTPGVPHVVVIDATPTITSVSPNQGSVEGGTTVTIAGTLFQEGASVLFGTVPAADVAVVNSNQITCTAPAHFPAYVDVKVVNPDATEVTSLNAFRYQDEDVVVDMPSLAVDFGSIIEMPLAISNVDGLLAATFTVTFDSSVLSLQNVDTGAMTYGWGLSHFSPNASTVIIALASATSVTGAGTLAELTFEVVGAPTTQSPLSFAAVEINGGSVPAVVSDGLVTVNGSFALDGTVTYYNGGGAVPGVDLTLVGSGLHTATSDGLGAFAMSEIQSGSYILSAEKYDDVAEITSMDASLILQKVVGITGFTANQAVAADVDNSGSVTSMDASYVLMHSVGLIESPFPGNANTWEFVPETYNYALINGDLTNQDFTAILVGDVSGNWAFGGTNGSEIKSSPTVRVAELEGSQGDQVTLPVEIELAGQDVHAIDLVVEYDVTRLSLVSVVRGSAADNMSYAVNTNETGKILAGLAGAMPLTSDGPILDITFEVLENLAETAQVQLVKARLDEGAVLAVLEDGGVAPQTTGIPGDLDLDGLVNSRDLDLVRANWGRTVTPGSLLDGDASGDGKVGSADLDLVRANWGRVAAAAFARPFPSDGEENDSSAEDERFAVDNESLAEAAWAYELEGLERRFAKKKETLVDAVFALRFFGPTLDS